MSTATPNSFRANRIAWGGLSLGLVLGFALLAWLRHPRAPAPAIDVFEIAEYTDEGEALVHGVWPPRLSVSNRMPLATTLSSLLFAHSGLAAPSINGLLRGAAVLLTIAVGGLMAPFTTGVPLIAAAAVGRIEDFPERFFSLLLLVIAGLLVRRARAPSLTSAFLLALAMGSANLFRSVLAYFPPVLILFECFARRRNGFKDYWKQGLVLAVVPYLFIVPWIRMNANMNHQFVPFELRGGNINVVTGVLGLVRGSGGDPKALVDSRWDVAQGSEVVYWAAGEIARHPARFLLGYGRRLRFIFSLNPLLWLAAGYSLWRFRERPDYRQLGILILYFVGIYSSVSVVEHYIEPVFPLLGLLAASLVPLCWRRGASAAEPPSKAAEFALLTTLGTLLFFCGFAARRVNAYAELAAGAVQSSQGLDEALLRYPDDPWLLSYRAGQKLRAGLRTEAIRDFARAADAQPGNPEHALRLAYAKALDGDAGPLSAFSPPRDTENPRLSVFLGLDWCLYRADVMYRLGRKAAFAAAVKEGVERARRASALAETAAGESEEGIRIVERLRLYRGVDLVPQRIVMLIPDLTPKERRAFADEFRVLLSPDESARAEEILFAGPRPASSAKLLCDQAAGSREAVEACFSLADDAARQGKADKALALLDRIGGLTLDADKSFRLALSYQDLKQYSRASRVFADLTKKSPSSAAYFHALGVCQFLDGRPEDAVASLRAALALDPNLYPARKSLDAILAARKK